MKGWKLKEKNDAKTIKGKVVRGSGSRWYNPGDARSDNFLVESKYTEKGSYSLNKKKLDKLYREALMTYKIPLFMVQIQDTEVVVMFKDDFENAIRKDE
jgi:hypothetical protein